MKELVGIRRISVSSSSRLGGGDFCEVCRTPRLLLSYVQICQPNPRDIVLSVSASHLGRNLSLLSRSGICLITLHISLSQPPTWGAIFSPLSLRHLPNQYISLCLSLPLGGQSSLLSRSGICRSITHISLSRPPTWDAIFSPSLFQAFASHPTHFVSGICLSSYFILSRHLPPILLGPVFGVCFPAPPAHCTLGSAG